MTAPEPLFRGVSSPTPPLLPEPPPLPQAVVPPQPAVPPTTLLPPDKSILLVKTSLESFRNVWVKLRDASAKVRVSETAKVASSRSVELLLPLLLLLLLVATVVLLLLLLLLAAA